MINTLIAKNVYHYVPPIRAFDKDEEMSDDPECFVVKTPPLTYVLVSQPSPLSSRRDFWVRVYRKVSETEGREGNVTLIADFFVNQDISEFKVTANSPVGSALLETIDDEGQPGWRMYDHGVYQ